MTILTSSGTFAIGAGTVETLSTTITIAPAAGVGEGTGRLIHPTPGIGTYDYYRGPDAWRNVDGDVIISPIWDSSKTLLGSANTLFVGDIRDVIVEERWTQSVAMELDMARALIAMWQNPPDPAVAYVQWYPSYSCDLGFNVVILSLGIGGEEGIELTPLVKNGVGYVRGPVVLKMRIASRV